MGVLPVQVASAQPQSTTVLVPSNGATVAGTQVVLDASAPAGTSQVQFELTGGTLSDSVIATATPTLYGWVVEWNSTTVAVGTYTLQSVATEGGSTGTSPGISITVNNPVTSVLVPSDGATVAGTEVWFDASASAGVTEVQFELTGGSLSDSVIAIAFPSIYGWLATWPSQEVANGTYTLQSVATGVDGGTATSPGINITVDNSLQTEVILPEPGSALLGTAVLDATASSGDSAVTSVTFEYSLGPAVDIVIATATPTLYGWIAEWDTQDYGNNLNYELQSVATDAAGTTVASTPVKVAVVNFP